MPTGYAPTSAREYSSKDLSSAFRGALFQADPGRDTENDFKIMEDSLVDGALVIAIGSALGDKIKCQVVDVDGIMGMGAGAVLGQYVSDWYMNPSKTEQLDFTSAYPAKIFKGLYLRVCYTSVGESPVNVIINYKLHKVMW